MMNDVQAARFNARLANISSFLSDSTFILPIWLLYSLNVLHLRPILAVAIFMTIWIGSAVLEIPTGALADRLSRKKIFIVGQLLFCLYPLAYALKFSVVPLIMVCLISALGSAMRSGSLLPIVHASFKKAELSDKAYERFLSSNTVATFCARAVTGLVGAWLYSLNHVWPFYAMFFVTFINFLLGFFVKDTAVELEEEAAKTTNNQHIKQTLSIIRKSDVVFILIVAFGMLNFAAEATWTGYQVFFQADGRSAFIIGALFSVIAVCSAISAYFIRFAIGKFRPLTLIQFFGLGVLITTALIFQPNHALRLLAVVPMRFASGTSAFVMNATVQKFIANRYQATALSVVSFVIYAVYGIGSVGFGVLLQIFGVSKVRTILLVTALTMSALVALYTTGRARVVKSVAA